MIIVPAHGTFRIITVDARRPAIVCLLCHRTSHHLDDVAKRFCPACHLFHDDVMELRAYYKAGLLHDCAAWQTAAGHCAICGDAAAAVLQQAERIAPGVYIAVDGSLHLELKELLKANGYADTPANRAMLTRVTYDVMREHWPDIKIKQ